MIKCSTRVDLGVQKELSQKLHMASLISLIVGSIGILIYILFVPEDKPLADLWLIFSIPFAFGLVFLLTIKKTYKKIQQGEINENFYEFEESYLNVTTHRNNEDIGTIKVYYKDLLKIRETKNYFFLYLNTFSALPVSKNLLISEEIDLLRTYFKK